MNSYSQTYVKELPLPSPPVPVALCAMTENDVEDMRQCAAELSRAGIPSYMVFPGEHWVIQARDTANARVCVCIFLFTEDPVPAESAVWLRSAAPLYFFRKNGEGKRIIERFTPTAPETFEEWVGAVDIIKIQAFETKKDKRKKIIAGSILAVPCLTVITALIVSCGLTAGRVLSEPMPFGHGYIDVSPYGEQAQTEQENNSGIWQSLMDTPTYHDENDTMELMHEKLAGDFIYKQYIGGDVIGKAYISEYVGSDTNVTLPTKLDGIEVLGMFGAFEENTEIVSVTVPEGYIEISDNSFKNCTSLKTVNLPSTVTKIGSYAFYGCESLSEIKLPDGIASIDTSAFSGCGSLSKIALPDSLTSINDWAFKDCVSLKSIKFPEGLTEICSSAFSGCVSLESVSIPDRVTTLEQGAFGGCTSLKTVSMGDGITVIESSAFRDCENLKQIKFGESVKEIKSGAFSNCGITELTIPQTVRTIEERAFRDCVDLSAVNLPADIGSLKGSAFSGCESLKKFGVYGSGSGLSETDGVLFSGDGKTLLKYPCARIGRYDVPDGVTVIGASAFYGVEGLDEIGLPDTLESIQSYAFAYSGLQNITVPKNVTCINEGAFQNCELLESVYLGGSLDDVENYIFSYCPKLKSIKVSDKCENFKCVNGLFIDTRSGLIVAAECGLSANLVIPDGIKGECAASLAGHGEIVTVTFPQSHEEVGRSSFKDCASLKKINFGGSETKIYTSAFSGCSALESVVIPESVDELGQSVFSGCTSLRSAVLADGVTLLPQGLFSESGIESIYIPDSVTEINGAFKNCTELKRVILSDGLEELDNNAFEGCTALTELYVPTSLEWFSTGIFTRAPSLETIYYNGTKREWQRGLKKVSEHPYVPDNVTIVYDSEKPEA